MKATSKLKEIVARRAAVQAPGTANALFARVIEVLCPCARSLAVASLVGSVTEVVCIRVSITAPITAPPGFVRHNAPRPVQHP